MLDEGVVVPARKSASISEFASDLPHHVTRQLRQSVRLGGTAGDIMQAARELFAVLQKPNPAWEPALLYRAIRATYNT